MPYTVGQLARLTGITIRALHHYDTIGLLSPLQRSEAGYRLYADSDLVRLFRIQALRRLGLTLADIGQALNESSEALPRLILQQIDELDATIEHATALRERLARLRDALMAGSAPAPEDWLSALELVSQYDRAWSAAELETLVANSRNAAAEWPRLVADIRLAMEAGVSPASEAARALAGRWRGLVMSQAGGDMALAIKVKRAYNESPELQARARAHSGLDHAVVAFLTDVWRSTHLERWAQHLDAADLELMGVGDERMTEWIRVAGELREAMNQGAPADHQDVGRLLASWDRILDASAGGSPRLRLVIESALRSDHELQGMWALDADLIEFVERARQSAGRKP